MLHLDLRQVELVLQRRAGRGAHHVAEIVEHAARHDRVEVHHAHGLAGLDVEHHVVELGVVVRDALGDFALRQSVKDHVRNLLLFAGELDLAFGLGRAVELVLLNRLLQRGKAPARVVKMRNGLGQALSGQIHQQALKPPEGLARFIGLDRRLHRFVRAHALDKHERAPALAGGRPVIRPALQRRNDR